MSFTRCRNGLGGFLRRLGLGDAMLGRWLFLPLFVAAFYGGMIIIDLVTYPMLSFWRGWLRRRGLMPGTSLRSAGSGGTTTLVLLVLSPWWLRWNWNGALPLEVLGGVVLIGSVVVGTWAVAKMGWAGCYSPGLVSIGSRG